MEYNQHIFSNGLQMIHKKDVSPVVYCGMMVDTGSRDEQEDEQGMAHFIEHMLFKGTEKRRSAHIINRLENVGGELNAYTSKEETVVYASVLREYAERAVELISDLVFHSVFPQKEIEKEVVVIIDEINSYSDSPSELIYDDFEELLFPQHTLGRNILGIPERLKQFDSASAKRFTSRNYRPDRMVFFITGNLDFRRLIRWGEKYFTAANQPSEKEKRVAPEIYLPLTRKVEKNTNQVHFMVGGRSYDMYHPRRTAMYLLNNILGGPGMNSLLNLSLREKYGLVYNVESTFQPFTDTGLWSVYFGCDPENAPRCEQLVRAELQKLCAKPLDDKMLNRYKLQLYGQMAISSENRESFALSIGKTFMRYGNVENIEVTRKKIENIRAELLQEIACEMFQPDRFTVLKYE